VIRLILACIAVCAASYVVTVGHVETHCVESQGVWDCHGGPGEEGE
jgi:hypothetical protein